MAAGPLKTDNKRAQTRAEGAVDQPILPSALRSPLLASPVRKGQTARRGDGGLRGIQPCRKSRPRLRTATSRPPDGRALTGASPNVVDLGGAPRPGARVKWSRVPERPFEDVAALIERGANTDATLWLIGGEPTLRPDLLRIVRHSRAAGAETIGVETDGLALAQPGALAALAAAGLTHVRLRLFSSRPDAHDWIVGRAGAWRTTCRAARLAADAGVTVSIATLLTRPTTPHLAELTALAQRLGAESLLAGLTPHDALHANEVIALAPRLSLVADPAADARAAALKVGIELSFRGLPHCVVGATLETADRHNTAPRAARCADCRDGCPGVARAYVERFGDAELLGLGPAHGLTDPAARDADDPLAPPPRALRVPTARLADARHSARLTTHPPRLQVNSAPPSTTGYLVIDATTSSREIRSDLIVAAQQGLTELRLVGSGVWHRPELVREALKLSLTRVSAVGDGAPLAGHSAGALYPLKRLDHASVVLHGPDAGRHDARVGASGSFDAAIAGAAKLARVAKLPVELCCVIYEPEDVAAYAERVTDAVHPRRFRLSLAGGALAPVQAAIADLDDAPRRMLAAALPDCRARDVGASANPSTSAQDAPGTLLARSALTGSDALRWDRFAPTRLCGRRPDGYGQCCGMPERWRDE